MIEIEAEKIKARWKLSSLHIFDSGEPQKKWRVFGFRRDKKGFQASCEEGEGTTILEALADLDRFLKEGPTGPLHVARNELRCPPKPKSELELFNVT